MADVLWSIDEMKTLADGLNDLQERLQEWEAESGLKIADIQFNIETQDRPVKHLGYVSFLDKGDTTLQFEVLDTEPTLTIA